MSDNYRDVWFAYGFKTKGAADEAIRAAFAGGEISECEHPRIESYPVFHPTEKVIRYGIRVTV